MTIRRLVPGLILAFATSQAALADTLYKCQNAEGRTTYTNQKLNKACEIISQDKPVSSFATPPAKAKQASPADFPKVENSQQKARDTDRRAILEQELANETRNLETAKQTLTEQESQILPDERIAGGGIQQPKRDARIQTHRDKVALHERNIASLRRELANLK